MNQRQIADKTHSQTSLTPKQAEVLEFIRQEISRAGRAPTYRDIAKYCGYEAVGTVQDHVRALIRKGYLEKEPGVSRGIRLPYRNPSIEVPILGVIPAGNPIEAIENILGTLSIPGRWKGDLYALRVKGESMIGAGILEGDYVVVKKQASAEHGEIIVAMIDGEATVKRLEKKSGRVRLLPENPKFAPIEIPDESQNVIQGRVVAVQRLYS